jgi:hypothetical protein
VSSLSWPRGDCAHRRNIEVTELENVKEPQIVKFLFREWITRFGPRARLSTKSASLCE